MSASATHKTSQGSDRKPRPRPFRLTSERLAVIESLSDYGTLDTRQLTRLRLGVRRTTREQERDTTKLLRILRERGLVRTRPGENDEREAGGLVWFMAPVHGLTEEGVRLASDPINAFPDPKEFSQEKKLRNIPHDIKRSLTHERIEWLCDDMGWGLGWRKTDLYRLVEPDDLYWIVRPERTLRFFHEEENEKKTHRDLYDKLMRYEQMKPECMRLWGFERFYVTVQFANEERMTNLLAYLNGACTCQTRKHTCLPKLGLPLLQSRTYLFTHDEAIMSDAAAQIFRTSKDWGTRTYSFSDL